MFTTIWQQVVTNVVVLCDDDEDDDEQSIDVAIARQLFVFSSALIPGIHSCPLKRVTRAFSLAVRRVLNSTSIVLSPVSYTHLTLPTILLV
eukprot:2336174-Amphidinium_carterae.1